MKTFKLGPIEITEKALSQSSDKQFDAMLDLILRQIVDVFLARRKVLRVEEKETDEHSLDDQPIPAFQGLSSPQR